MIPCTCTEMQTVIRITLFRRYRKYHRKKVIQKSITEKGWYFNVSPKKGDTSMYHRKRVIRSTLWITSMRKTKAKRWYVSPFFGDTSKYHPFTMIHQSITLFRWYIDVSRIFWWYFFVSPLERWEVSPFDFQCGGALALNIQLYIWPDQVFESLMWLNSWAENNSF